MISSMKEGGRPGAAFLPARIPPTDGMSLLELLVGIAVFSFVVSSAALLFAHARKAWSEGTDRHFIDSSARCALDTLARDIEASIADEKISFCFRDDRFGISSYGLTNSELNLITISRKPEHGERAARAVQYWVRESPNAPGRFELVRGCRKITPGPSGPYHSANWFEEPDEGGLGRPDSPSDLGVVAENVALFRLAAADTSNRLARAYDSVLDGTSALPRAVDVYIEILPPEAARRAADMAGKGIDVSEYVENNSRRYAMVVSAENRHGHTPR